MFLEVFSYPSIAIIHMLLSIAYLTIKSRTLQVPDRSYLFRFTSDKTIETADRCMYARLLSFNMGDNVSS